MDDVPNSAAPPPGGARSTKGHWLDLGLDVLGRHGEAGLTVDALCAGMGKTKGSFYHHFSGRADFVAQLLEHWERAFTRRFIDDLEALDDPRERLRALGERTVQEVDLGLERTIRIWADREEAARVTLDRVDRTREGYLREQLTAVSGDPESAGLAARVHLALLVGVQMLYRDLPRDDVRRLNAFIGDLGFEPGLGNRSTTDTSQAEDTP
ncbi:MAG: TetR/AcrR family transcriptional regulator [Acidobacteriota bacterium]